jgi:hypothetical protein
VCGAFVQCHADGETDDESDDAQDGTGRPVVEHRMDSD